MISRRQACQIPEDILHDMTTDALFQTVLDYPFISDIYAFNNLSTGYETVKRRFNGLQELETRSDYFDVVSNYCNKCYSLDKKEKTFEDYVAEKLYLVAFNNLDLNISPYASCRMVTVYTPKDSPIPAVEGRTYGVLCNDISHNIFTQDEMQKAIERDKVRYPSATLLRGASSDLPSYNCYSYALYSQSYSNNKWVGGFPDKENGPWTYFTDGSYDLVVYDYPGYTGVDDFISPRGTAQVGDIFAYGYNANIDSLGPTHVGIVNSLRYQSGVDNVVSKWGAGGLWLHPWHDCPYIEETGEAYSIWRSAK